MPSTRALQVHAQLRVLRAEAQEAKAQLQAHMAMSADEHAGLIERHSARVRRFNVGFEVEVEVEVEVGRRWSWKWR